MSIRRSAYWAALASLVATAAAAAPTIPYPPGIELGGAAAYGGSADHQPSVYYRHPNFYWMKSGGSLRILPKFKTYQQTTEYSCGPAAVVMAAYYRGTTLNELEIAAAAGTTEEDGTTTKQLVDYLKSTGWTVRSSLTEPKVANLAFLKQQVALGHPVLVDWTDWAGHWQVVIGYDDLGTPAEVADDVIVVADPYDTTDHLQDGYGTVQAERFLYMWFDNLQPAGQRRRAWVLFDR
jgi:hypothetical protein